MANLISNFPNEECVFFRADKKKIENKTIKRDKKGRVTGQEGTLTKQIFHSIKHTTKGGDKKKAENFIPDDKS